jgi:hypothetical protein
MRTWKFRDNHPVPLPAGPWDDEPDKAQWIDEATDLDCLIVRNHYGALCGYVGLPPGHPLHGAHYDDDRLDVRVHGGLTFADSCQDGAEDGPGICHIPEAGRPHDVWWLGFDCAHAWDLAPGIFHGLPAELRPSIMRDCEYRTFDYVVAEVTGLAGQLAAPRTISEVM